MARRVTRYADEDTEPQAGPDEGQPEGVSESQDATESEAPVDSSAETGEPGAGMDVGMGEGMESDPGMEAQGAAGAGMDAAPPSHAEWLANFEYALQTNPILYGMAMHYAEQMAAQQGEAGAEQTIEGEMPPESGEQPTEDPAEQQAIDEAMSGGAGEMPEPGHEPEPNQPYGMFGLPTEKLAGAAGGGALGAAGGMALGAAGIGDPMRNAAIGGIGGAGIGAVTNMSNEVPVAYQAHIKKLEKRVATAEAAKAVQQQQIAQLYQINAIKESELVVYQLQLEGVKGLATPEDAQSLAYHLASLSPNDRQLKVNEIRNFWEKDSTVAYAAQGAPVGSFLRVTEEPAESKSRFDNKKLDIALAYQRSNPPELKGLSASEKWAKCEQYAMNGGVVTG